MISLKRFGVCSLATIPVVLATGGECPGGRAT